MFQDVHPVMALRTLITNFYNPIRISKFAKVVKEFFATTYFSASKHIRQLIDEMAENSMADSIEIQWVAYFIILSFNNTPNPKNRQKMLDPEIGRASCRERG
mgnify:CR=1 FL=1